MGAIFLNTLFSKLFIRESDITCIMTVVGVQQQHEGMFLKHGAGGGAKIFQQFHGRGRFFSRVFARGGGLFFFACRFYQTTTSPPPPRRP